MTDLVKQAEKHLSEVQSNKGRGLEGATDRNDLILPRAKKIEQMSPEMQDTALLKAGVCPGVIINSITKEILPEKFTPVVFFKNWIRFNPNKNTDRGWVDGFGPRDVVYITNDKNDPRLAVDAVWEGDAPPVTTTFLNFLSLFEGQSVPVIVSFGGTNFKSGKTLLSLATFKGGDLFSNKYRLYTKECVNGNDSWYTLQVAFFEKVQAEEVARCESLYESFKVKTVQVHTEEEIGF